MPPLSPAEGSREPPMAATGPKPAPRPSCGGEGHSNHLSASAFQSIDAPLFLLGHPKNPGILQAVEEPVAAVQQNTPDCKGSLPSRFAEGKTARMGRLAALGFSGHWGGGPGPELPTVSTQGPAPDSAGKAAWPSPASSWLFLCCPWPDHALSAWVCCCLWGGVSGGAACSPGCWGPGLLWH